MDLSYAPDSMRPVFLARLPSAQSTQQVPSLFAMSDASPQIPQLNWIGDVHMAPVFSAADANFLVDPKSDLKAAVLNDSQNGRDIQEAVEMTAFRFQR
jgi:alkyl hydroperoxide reductase subunit AhpC